MECSCEQKQVTRMNLMMCKSDWGKHGKKNLVITEKTNKNPTDVTDYYLS